MGVLTDQRASYTTSSESGEKPEVLARFPAMDPDRSLAEEPPRSPRPRRRSKTPSTPPLPNTRVLTLVVLGLLLIVCAAWVFWPAPAPSAPSGDITAPHLRTRQPAQDWGGQDGSGQIGLPEDDQLTQAIQEAGAQDPAAPSEPDVRLKGFIFVDAPAEESDHE